MTWRRVSCTSQASAWDSTRRNYMVDKIYEISSFEALWEGRKMTCLTDSGYLDDWGLFSLFVTLNTFLPRMFGLLMKIFLHSPTQCCIQAESIAAMRADVAEAVGVARRVGLGTVGLDVTTFATVAESALRRKALVRTGSPMPSDKKKSPRERRKKKRAQQLLWCTVVLLPPVQ